jgi:hypothetical protein
MNYENWTVACFVLHTVMNPYVLSEVVIGYVGCHLPVYMRFDYEAEAVSVCHTQAVALEKWTGRLV